MDTPTPEELSDEEFITLEKSIIKKACLRRPYEEAIIYKAAKLYLGLIKGENKDG